MMKLRPRTPKNSGTPLRQDTPRRASARLRLLRAATGTEGSQLLEFGLCLPFLLVFAVGIIEFGGAFNLKQKMANGAREGARITVSNSISDNTCSSSTPCAIQAAAAAVANYMTNAGVNSSCIGPGSPSSSGTLTWTYTCKSGISLTINRNYGYTSSGGQLYTGTKVTLSYPYTWGFNKVLGLLVPGSKATLPTKLTEIAIMQNLVSN